LSCHPPKKKIKASGIAVVATGISLVIATVPDLSGNVAVLTAVNELESILNLLILNIDCIVPIRCERVVFMLGRSYIIDQYSSCAS
jgi:hypothetical protein